MSGSFIEGSRQPLAIRSRLGSAVCIALAPLAVCSVLAFGVPTALGATAGTPYDLTAVDTPSPQPTGRFGERHAAAGDLNGDRVNDYWVGALSQDVLGVTNAGRVYAINGRTRTVLYSIASPEIQASANFGFYITNLGDVNSDGRADIAIGTDSQDVFSGSGTPCGSTEPNGCNEDQGKAWVFSGRTGGLLYAVENPAPQPSGRFGSRIGRAGDLNGDGAAESIMGASNNDLPAGCGETGTNPVPAGCRRNQGQAFIFDGKTGALFRTLNLPAADQFSATCSSGCGGLGLSAQGPGDVNGDGMTDQLVNASSLSYTANGTVCPDATAPGCFAGAGSMYLYSGANGNVLARIDDPTPEAGAVFGFQDVAPLAPGDVNGDGRAEIFANGFVQDGPAGDAQGRIWVFDGKATVANPAARGVVLYEPKDPTPSRGGQCCFSMDKTDFNKDGRPDLYVGASPHQLANTDQRGGTYIFDGRNGSLLKSFELPFDVGQTGSDNNLGSNLGWSVAAPGDLNGDGEPDYLAGATFQDVNDNRDEGRAFVFLSRVPRAAGPPPVYGFPSAPFAGCPTLTANIIRGTASANTITGTTRADRIFAGTGNDVVDALAGNDCVDLGPGADRGQGGSGADLLLGGLGKDRIAGSSGNDRIRGNSDGDRLNGGSGNDRVFGDGGSDLISGSFGNDVLHGVSGNDRISGSRGRDRINGGSGRDVISAGSSNDRVAGDQGNDRINGNSGNDSIRGNSGNDRLTGSAGSDRISGDSGNDRIDSRDGRRDRVSCGSGRDTVIADRFDRISRSCERVRRR